MLKSSFVSCVLDSGVPDMTTLLWDVGTIEYKLSRRPLVDAYSTVLFSSHKYRRSVGRLVVKGKINVHNTAFMPSVRGLPHALFTQNSTS